jgi:hypothetical protein
MPVIPICELIDWEEVFLGVESEVAVVVIGGIVGVRAVADDEELHEGEQRIGVAVDRVLLVVDDLLHSAAWTNFESLELDLCARDAVDE